jgi:hypothetical protein
MVEMGVSFSIFDKANAEYEFGLNMLL